MADLTRGVVGGTLAGQHVAALGIVFKPGQRRRATRRVSRRGQLTRKARTVRRHDPVAMGNAARVRPERLRYAETIRRDGRSAEIARTCVAGPTTGRH